MLLDSGGRQEHIYNELALFGGQTRPARQAQPAFEELSRNLAADHTAPREDGLQVHRLPEGASFDVLLLEGSSDVLARSPEPSGIESEASQPARRAPVG